MAFLKAYTKSAPISSKVNPICRKGCNRGSELVNESLTPRPWLRHLKTLCGRPIARSAGARAAARSRPQGRVRIPRLGNDFLGGDGFHACRACAPGASLDEAATGSGIDPRAEPRDPFKGSRPVQPPLHQSTNSSKRFWKRFVRGLWHLPMANRFGFGHDRRPFQDLVRPVVAGHPGLARGIPGANAVAKPDIGDAPCFGLAAPEQKPRSGPEPWLAVFRRDGSGAFLPRRPRRRRSGGAFPPHCVPLRLFPRVGSQRPEQCLVAQAGTSGAAVAHTRSGQLQGIAAK